MSRIRLRDVAWGIFIALAGIGLVVGIVVAVSAIRGTGGVKVCDQPLSAQGQSPITAAEMAAVDQGLAATVDAARQGNLPAAERSFFGRVHNFTHNVDPSIRQVNPALAKSLCESVLRVEKEFDSGRRADEIAQEVETLRNILQQAAIELGFQRGS